MSVTAEEVMPDSPDTIMSAVDKATAWADKNDRYLTISREPGRARHDGKSIWWCSAYLPPIPGGTYAYPDGFPNGSTAEEAAVAFLEIVALEASDAG